MQIAGSGAVVVGGASGMGRASAELLASKGARVAILDLPSSDGEAVARGLGDGAIFRPLDVMDEAAVEVVLAETVDALGGLRIAVNTAGGGVAQRTISSRGPHSLDDFRRVVEFNMVGTFNLNRWQAWNMRDNEPDDDERGVIINTASIAAYEGQIGQVAYSAAKAGIVGMTFTMARDLGRYGIRVNAIAPSLFSTGATSGIPADMAAGLTRDAAFPNRMGRPEEYARLAVAIAENPMLNGGTIRLDGGQRFAPR